MQNKHLSQLILILGSMLFFLQGDNYAAAPVLVDLADEFGLTPGDAALTVTAYMVPFGIFTLLFGPLGDRFGKATILRSASLLTGIFSIACAFMPTFSLICTMRILNGIFAAGVMPVAMALIGETAGNDKSVLQASLAKTMGLMFLGGAVGPAIGGWLASIGTWRLVYGFYGCIELILAMIIFIKIPAQPARQKKLQFISSYREAISRPGVIMTVPILFLVGIAVLGFFPFTGKFIEGVSTLSLSSIGLILSVFGFGAVIGGRVAQSISIRIGKLYFPLAGSIGASSLILISTNTGLPVIMLGLAGYGFSFMMLQPMLVARAQQAMPEGRGTVMSLASLNMALGGGIGTYLIGELPLQSQVRLLKVLQSKEIERVGGDKTISLDIRIIAATNRNLEEMVKLKEFREDLWFRINVFPILIPPLRDRHMDIPALILHFISQKARELKLPTIPTLSPGAIDPLMEYHWPGNVRELENIVERALIMDRNGPLDFANLLPLTYNESSSDNEGTGGENDTDQGGSLDEVISRHIRRALEKTDGRVTGPGGAAEILGLNPSTLRNRMKKLGIEYGRAAGSD